ncbi:MAG: hypothetical protein WBM29_03075, partial [Candidatus Deferrimicrobium sp.]
IYAGAAFRHGKKIENSILVIALKCLKATVCLVRFRKRECETGRRRWPSQNVNGGGGSRKAGAIPAPLSSRHETEWGLKGLF